ncbi:hypothetical protein GEMRC1_007163 [Eukaryota sp. GEM-RC1]
MSSELKLILLGAMNVGKTCLLNVCFLKQQFNRVSNTVGVAFRPHRISRPPIADFNMSIWDTAGAEAYQSLSSLYMRSSDLSLVCFDPTDTSSFDAAKRWIKELQELQPDCQIFLVATKIDLVSSSWEVPESHIYSWMKDANIHHFFQTSSKTGEGITQLYNVVEDTAVQLYQKKQPSTDVDISSSPRYLANCSC